MSLEAYTGNLSDLVITNPTPTDPKSQGDDHLRGIKKTLVDTFGETTGPIYGPSGVTFPDGTVQGSAAYSKAQSDGPAFRCYQNAASGLNGTSQKVPFQVVENNLGNGWIAASNRFQPNVAGYYQINWSIQTDGNSVILDTILDKNGSQWAFGSRAGVKGTFSRSVGSSLVYLNGSTDYIEILAQTDVEAATSGALSTQVSGFLARRS